MWDVKRNMIMKNFSKKCEELAGIARTYNALKTRCNHVAGIYYNEKLIVYGRNKKKSHPLQARYSDRPHRIYLHAEIDAIVNFLKEYSIWALRDTEMVVIRLTPDNVLGNSQPCTGCMRAITSFELKSIKWS